MTRHPTAVEHAVDERRMSGGRLGTTRVNHRPDGSEPLGPREAGDVGCAVFLPLTCADPHFSTIHSTYHHYRQISLFKRRKEP
jgi:hypothetical protein